MTEGTKTLAPAWLIKRIKAAKAEIEKELSEASSYAGPDPNPKKTIEMKLRIGNYDEILGWMKKAEQDFFKASLDAKYR